MRVDAQQEMLDDHQTVVAGHVERRPPATWHIGLTGPGPHVPPGEGAREVLHPSRVLEPPVRGSCPDAVGHPRVQRREVPGGVAGVERDAAQFVDRRRQHSASHGNPPAVAVRP